MIENDGLQRQRRRYLPEAAPQGAHRAALASRLLPLLILAGATAWWVSSMTPAMGQFQSGGQFQGGGQGYAQPYQQTGPGYTNGGVPSIPSAAMGSDPATDAGDEADSAQAQAWQMPAIVNKIAQGGLLMIPLGVCSLIVITLSLERLIALRRGRVIPRPFVRRFTECVEDGQLSFDEATELCEEFECPVAEVFQAAVRRWGRPMLEVEQAVMDAGDRVADSLKRFVRVFHAISNVAPLIGLLGTVLGMIE
ncbi:MAG: MotA/TolQ/ExbB proton channel family protein, partial [Planctomycetes bacterium]|nr:MotA/TolQ/ExbB proton channel family protein [Planctomycetota bacterium]